MFQLRPSQLTEANLPYSLDLLSVRSSCNLQEYTLSG